MTEVDRYDMIVSNAGNYMEIRSDGDWVEFDDYERLEAINAELKEQQKTDYDKREALDDELSELKAINAELLAACEQTLEIVRYLDGKAVDILEAAIEKAKQ